MSELIHKDENTNWRLVTRDSTSTGEKVLEAALTIPYDGVLVRSTETRNYVSHRKNSTFNLSVSEVLDHYEAKTGARPEVEL